MRCDWADIVASCTLCGALLLYKAQEGRDALQAEAADRGPPGKGGRRVAVLKGIVYAVECFCVV